MYETNENQKMIVNLIIDDQDFQDRLFSAFNAEERKDLIGSLMEVEILRRSYDFIFDMYVSKVYEMFGERKGDVLIELLSRMTVAKKELQIEIN